MEVRFRERKHLEYYREVLELDYILILDNDLYWTINNIVNKYE
ncbi:MAG: hypothetical protein K0S47_1659 [Herbinix sp.]|jgi:hypothetical protein|nr:hypothetical protein [Herbinix sp.]